MDIIDILLNKPIGSTKATHDFATKIIIELDFIKESKKTTTFKKEAVEKIITKYYNKHGAECHFFLQKHLHNYVTKKREFEKGVLNEILGKQMLKCGCECNNKV